MKVADPVIGADVTGTSPGTTRGDLHTLLGRRGDQELTKKGQQTGEKQLAQQSVQAGQGSSANSCDLPHLIVVTLTEGADYSIHSEQR